MRAKCAEDDHRKETHREQFRNFKAYCTERWGMSKNYAIRLIRGTQVAVNLSTRVDDFALLVKFSQLPNTKSGPLSPFSPHNNVRYGRKL
jgi:hypothetical protein